jgi:hypothetical protein
LGNILNHLGNSTGNKFHLSLLEGISGKVVCVINNGDKNRNSESELREDAASAVISILPKPDIVCAGEICPLPCPPDGQFIENFPKGFPDDFGEFKHVTAPFSDYYKSKAENKRLKDRSPEKKYF